MAGVTTGPTRRLGVGERTLSPAAKEQSIPQVYRKESGSPSRSPTYGTEYAGRGNEPQGHRDHGVAASASVPFVTRQTAVVIVLEPKKIFRHANRRGPPPAMCHVPKVQPFS